MCARCINSLQKKRIAIRGYRQQQEQEQKNYFLVSDSTLETGSRIGILDSKLAASEVERSAVICVVGHGYPTSIGVCIREEGTRVESLVVHERLAMASRVRLVKAGAGVALRAKRTGRRDTVVTSCCAGGKESRVSRAMRWAGGRGIVIVVCARVVVAAG